MLLTQSKKKILKQQFEGKHLQYYCGKFPLRTLINIDNSKYNAFYISRALEVKKESYFELLMHFLKPVQFFSKVNFSNLVY